MTLNEIFGKSSKKSELTPDEKEEMRRNRINKMRVMDKPMQGKKDFNVSDKSNIKGPPEGLKWGDYLEWHKGELESQGKYDSEGPKKGDIVMTRNGALKIVSPNGGGPLVATVESANGDSGTLKWTGLSRPVRHHNRQYYKLGN